MSKNTPQESPASKVGEPTDKSAFNTDKMRAELQRITKEHTSAVQKMKGLANEKIRLQQQIEEAEQDENA